MGLSLLSDYSNWIDVTGNLFINRLLGNINKYCLKGLEACKVNSTVPILQIRKVKVRGAKQLFHSEIGNERHNYRPFCFRAPDLPILTPLMDHVL